MFFSFDGIDGVGKTTQINLFCDWLKQLGHEVVTCRDPGSTPLGESIRDILLKSESMPIHRRSEMLLYMAARAQLIEEIIVPAQARGKTVVCDRFLLANIVYQGYAGGIDIDSIRQVGEVATCNIQPKLTFLLDMSVEDAIGRMNRTLDRMESQGTDFMRRVRRGFLTEAENRPDTIAVIDAARDVETIQSEIRQRAERLLNLGQEG